MRQSVVMDSTPYFVLFNSLFLETTKINSLILPTNTESHSQTKHQVIKSLSCVYNSISQNHLVLVLFPKQCKNHVTMKVSIIKHNVDNDLRLPSS